MIKVEHIVTWGFEHAIRGMRNPLNSWDRSDSKFDYDKMCLGENDLTLMRKLYAAGQPHRKYLRQIFVSMDITAPLYWWKEFDTYKVGTTANSCSTMFSPALVSRTPMQRIVVSTLTSDRDLKRSNLHLSVRAMRVCIEPLLSYTATIW